MINRTSLRSAAAVLLIAANSRGAEQIPTPSAKPATARVEQITVKLGQFDVVVRDRAGKFVSGLGPADFRVVEDGAPLEIVAVDEWGDVTPPTAGPPPSTASTDSSTTKGASEPARPPISDSQAAKPEQRSFAIVFDALGDSTALRMNQAKRAATNFIQSRFKTGDLGVVYQLDLSLRPISGITGDRQALTRGIEKVAWMPASSLADQINESVLAYTSRGNAPYQRDRLEQQSANVAGKLDWEREHVYSKLSDVAAVFQGMPGKRVLVLVSPGFPMTTNADARVQTGGFTPKFQSMLKAMATYGITVYTLDIGSELTAGDAGEAIDWRIAVGKLGMDENVLSDLGMERTLGTNSAGSRRQFLGVIAAETGGRMLTDTDLSRAFTAIDEETSHFYRISCRVPVMSETNRYRGLKVTVTREGYTVAGRRGRYSDVTPLERVPSDKLAAPVDSLAGYRRLTTSGAAVALPSVEGSKVPVVVVLHVTGPVEVVVDSEGRGELDLQVLIVARAADEVVARYERGFTAKIKPEGLGPIRTAFRVEGRLDLVPGIYEIQGTVRLAGPAQVGLWTGAVAVAPQPKSGSAAILGPVLASGAADAAPLLSRPPIEDSADPLSVKPGLRLLPSADLAGGGPIFAVFWLREFGSSAEQPPALDLGVKILSASGAETTAPAELVYFAPVPSGGYQGVVKLDASKLDAGTYLVQIAATPPGAPLAVTRRSAPFELSPAPSGPPAATKAPTSSAL